MHFAQTLDASVIPEWKSRYIDFSQGKKLIAKIDRSLPDAEFIPQNRTPGSHEPVFLESMLPESESSVKNAILFNPVIRVIQHVHMPHRDPPLARSAPAQGSIRLSGNSWASSRGSRPSAEIPRSDIDAKEPEHSISDFPGPASAPERLVVGPRSNPPSPELTGEPESSMRSIAHQNPNSDRVVVSGRPNSGPGGSGPRSEHASPFASPMDPPEVSQGSSFSLPGPHTGLSWHTPAESPQAVFTAPQTPLTAHMDHLGTPALPLNSQMRSSDNSSTPAGYSAPQEPRSVPQSPFTPSRTPPASSSQHSASPEPDGLEYINNAVSGIFFDWLNQEVERANGFFADMLAESQDKLDMLVKQLAVFEQHRRLHHAERDTQKHPHATKHATSFIERLDMPSVPRWLQFWNADRGADVGNTFSRQIRRLRDIGALTAGQSRVQRAQVLRTTAHTSDFSNSKDAVGYYQAKAMLKTALSEFYHSLQQLRGFQQLNLTAIRKIVKKFDKQICDKHHWHHTETEYLKDIRSLDLYSGEKRLSDMIYTVENLYAFHFTSSNHKNAVDSLRVTTLGEREQHPFALMISGLALGAAVPLGVMAIYAALHFRHDHSRGSSAETTYLLQILGGFACIAVCLVGFSGCLYLWASRKINYAFILELDRTTMMTPAQFMLYAALYTFWLALMAFLTFTTTSPFHRYYPILILGVSVLVLAWPFGKSWNSRAWLLHSLWRLLFSGLYPVEFRDLLTGDIFCSLTYSVSNMELFFCVYAASPKWWTIGGAEHAQRCTSSHSRALGFLNCLPGIFRFLQCWRRYGDTLDWFPHLLNAGKYTFNILYNMSLSLARISSHSSGLKAFFIFCALVNGIYSGSWDVLMDFSLTPGPRRKLRSVLVFPEWWYWVLMIFDFTLRQNWVLYVAFWQNKSQGAYISFIVALLEITRRVVWVAFRVENEHAANILRCRAFKDLHLPYDDVLKRDHQRHTV